MAIVHFSIVSLRWILCGGGWLIRWVRGTTHWIRNPIKGTNESAVNFYVNFLECVCVCFFPIRSSLCDNDKNLKNENEKQSSDCSWAEKRSHADIFRSDWILLSALENDPMLNHVGNKPLPILLHTVAHHLIRFMYAHAFIKYYCTVFCKCWQAPGAFSFGSPFFVFLFFSSFFLFFIVFLVTTSQFFELFCGELFFWFQLLRFKKTKTKMKWNREREKKLIRPIAYITTSSLNLVFLFQCFTNEAIWVRFQLNYMLYA